MREYPAYVYAIQCGDHVKIGMAEDTRTRLQTLKLTCPYPMVLLARRRFPTRDIALQVERQLHRQLQGQSHWGEWFTTSPVDPVQALVLAYDAMREGLELPVVDTLLDEPPPIVIDLDTFWDKADQIVSYQEA